MIKIAPIKIENSSKVDFDCKFIVNDILPIAINQPTEEMPFYTLLFCCHQDIRDMYMYFQLPIIFSTPEEEQAIKNKKYYIERIQENKEAYKEFIDLTINMRIENLFTTDLDHVSFPDKPYCKFQGIRRIGQGIYLRREIQITRLNWLLCNLFLEELFYDLHWNGKYFNDVYYLSPKWIKVDHFNYDAATRKIFSTFKTKENTIQGSAMIMNHYIIGCGPTEYKINWITPDKYPDKILRKALDIKIYLAEYSQHPTVNNLIYDKVSGMMYILVNDPKKLAILSIEPDILSKTNFLDIYNNVYEN